MQQPWYLAVWTNYYDWDIKQNRFGDAAVKDMWRKALSTIMPEP